MSGSDPSSAGAADETTIDPAAAALTGLAPDVDEENEIVLDDAAGAIIGSTLDDPDDTVDDVAS